MDECKHKHVWWQWSVFGGADLICELGLIHRHEGHMPTPEAIPVPTAEQGETPLMASVFDADGRHLHTWINPTLPPGVTIERGQVLRSKQFANDQQRVEWNLSHHAPGEAQIASISVLRDVAKEFAEVIAIECPLGRERSLAFTSLEDALQYAIASIARAEVIDG